MKKLLKAKGRRRRARLLALAMAVVLAAALMAACAAAKAPPGEEQTAMEYEASFVYIGSSGYDSGEPAGAVIGSVAELQAFYRQNRSDAELGPDLFAEAIGDFDDAFFGQNALILLCLHEGSSSITHELRSLTSEAGTLHMQVVRQIPEGMMKADMATTLAIVRLDAAFAAYPLEYTITEEYVK